MKLIGRAYLEQAKQDFADIKKLGDRTLERLDAASLAWSPDQESNSIVVLVKHMHGNMLSRWRDFLTTDGEKPDRDRDGEFVEEHLSKDEVLSMWEEGWQLVFDTLDSLEEEDLLKTILIRGEGHSVLKAIQRQIAHYSSHVGQIVYLGKWIKKGEWESLSIPRARSK